MAGIQWSWTKLLLAAAAVAVTGAGQSTLAQSFASPSAVSEAGREFGRKSGNNSGGTITGKLTDLHSTPLDGATVVVRNEATGAEARATTARNGSFRFSGLEAGEYTLEAESKQLGRGHLEGIFVAAGHEACVQTAMEFELPTPRLFQTEPHAIAAVRPVVTSTLTAEPLRMLPLTMQALLARTLPMPTQPELMRDAPALVMPVLTAMIAAEPLPLELLQPLPLVGQPLAAIQPDQFQVQLNKASQEDTLVTARSNTDPVTPAVTETLTGAQLQALPVSGRRWQDFALDAPTGASASGGTRQSGAGQETFETTVDGSSTRLAFGGQGGAGPESSRQGSNGEQSGMGQVWAGGHGFAVAEAAIREVQTSAGDIEAEGTRAAGGRMNVETQSGETGRGTNGLHGQGFLFDRQNTWGAQNPFTQWVKEAAPATETTTPVFTPQPYTPPDHETTWSIGAGSQIRRDKLFWFAALDSYQRNDPGLATVKHPYLCANPPQCTEQTGFFAQPSNDEVQVLSARLGLNGNNPVAAGLEAYSNMLGTLDGLLGPAPRTATQWLGFSRIDWQAAERHRFTLEGIGAAWDSPGGGLTRVSANYGSNSFGTSQASENMFVARWEAFLTPNLLAVTEASMGRNIQSARPDTPSAFEQTLLGPNVWGQLPQITVDSRYGFTIGNPSRFGQGSYPDEKLYQTQESVDWVRATLLIKAGFAVNHNFDATSLLRNQTGTYSYANVENFASDALAFAAFGISGQLNPDDQHNCDQTGKAWRDTTGQLRGLGYLPCYAYYSQTLGPSNWHLSTNDWAGFMTTQWQPKKLLVFSAGLRWEREQLPPPIVALANPDLPLTQRLPSLGNSWGPRLSMALGAPEGGRFAWPVLRLGYGMYFGRTENATVETALTQTGSANGDLNFFMRPTDNLNAGGAPPFPYVLAGAPGSIVKPGAVEFAPVFRNPEVHQGVAALEETLPGHVQLTASTMASLGRRLPISIDTNLAPPTSTQTITYGVVDATGLGPIKATQITVPFYASWPSATGLAGRLNPNYQQISQIMSRANSTYEAAMVRITRNGRRGLSLNAHYVYSHATDWNPNESTLAAGSDVLDPANFSQEYGTSNLDMRHSATAVVIYEAPWKLHNLAGRVANGWMLSSIGQFHSGLPYTMRTSGSLAEEFNVTSGAAIVGLGPGMNGSGGDNRVYGLGGDGRSYNIGRNTYRYPATWKADMRLAKSFDLGHMRQLDLLAESFNLFNHENVTELETTGYYIESGSASGPPTLNFLTGPVVETNGAISRANTTAFGQPLNINATDFYRERQIQIGLRLRF